jgi:hypothetical protein
MAYFSTIVTKLPADVMNLSTVVVKLPTPKEIECLSWPPNHDVTWATATGHRLPQPRARALLVSP